MTEDQFRAQQLRAYLTSALNGTGNVDLQWAVPTPMNFYWRQAEVPNLQALAEELLSDADFRAIQLGTWLNTPNGELISGVVLQLLPYPYSGEAKLLIEALELAAKMQRTNGNRRVRILAGAAVLALIALA
jgi:hypothetical protein